LFFWHFCFVVVLKQFVVYMPKLKQSQCMLVNIVHARTFTSVNASSFGEFNILELYSSPLWWIITLVTGLTRYYMTTFSNEGRVQPPCWNFNPASVSNPARVEIIHELFKLQENKTEAMEPLFYFRESMRGTYSREASKHKFRQCNRSAKKSAAKMQNRSNFFAVNFLTNKLHCRNFSLRFSKAEVA
jgi:hypothetical protein